MSKLSLLETKAKMKTNNQYSELTGGRGGGGA